MLDELNAEYETYLTFEQLPPNEKWDIKSYEEFAVDCAKKIVEYRADCEKYGTTMEELLKSLRKDFPDATILGHRDLPGVRKECPCFSVKEWLEEIKS